MIENLDSLIDALEMLDEHCAERNARIQLEETLAHLAWYSRERTLDLLDCLHGDA